MKKLSIIICTICIIFGSFSCSDMLESDSSRQVFDPALDQKTDSVFYALGILQGMQQLADQYMFQGELRGDLVNTTEYTDSTLRQLANFTAATAQKNKYDSAYVYYRVINNCNYYIAHRDTMLRTGFDYVAMKEYVAVKSIRAWAYMQLARVYGSVPFYTEPLTQISQIDNNTFPMKDLAGVVAELAPDLEQYSHTEYANTPTFGNVSPAAIVPSALFIPVDVVLGDMYLEAGNYDKAALHYIYYLTEVATTTHTAYMESFTQRQRFYGQEDERPGDWDNSLNSELPRSSADTWSNIFSGTSGIDYITYIPMATSKLNGTASEIPLAFGYDYYANSSAGTSRYVDEVQIVPSDSYTELSENTDYYYLTNESNEIQLRLSYAKLGDQRIRNTTREDTDQDTDLKTVWITKNNSPRVILYRRSTVLLHLAEAFNRLGMYDAAFAILKDGINRYLIDAEGGANYITPETRAALQETYPLLSRENVAKFSTNYSFFGVHMHGAGYTRDYTGSTYQAGLSKYQPDTIIGLKLAEIAEQYQVAVGTTKEDTINAMEDVLCDEYALELAFEGSRFFDLCRLARHKNEAGLYDPKFGTKWLAKKLAFKVQESGVNLEDERNWYLPFR